MKQLMIAGVVATGLVTAMGTARSMSTGNQGPDPMEGDTTCTFTVFVCPTDETCEYDGASSVGCETECGLTMTVFQARIACGGCCNEACGATAPSSCPD